MPVPDLEDKNIFPTYASCPEASSTPSTSSTSPTYLLAQITDNMTITKPTLIMSDRAGSPFALVFDGLDDARYGSGLDLKALGLRKGATAVVLDARRTPPKDESGRGFVAVDGRRAGEVVKAVPAPLEQVVGLADLVRTLESTPEGKGGCIACGNGGEGVALKKCTGCGVVSYCGKVSRR